MRLNTKINKIPSKIHKKYSILVVIIFSFLFLPIIFLIPQKASAQGVFVPTSDITLQGIATTNAGSNAWKVSRQQFFDTVAYSATNVVIQTISANLQNKIINASNSFVKNLGTDLRNVENKVRDKLAANNINANGCFPTLNGYLAPIPKPVWTLPKFKLSITCTPAQTSAMNDFYKPGGFNWDSFKKMASDPSRYNPFGVAVSASIEFKRERTNARKRELTQLQWGRGIRAVTDSLTGLIKTPAASVQGLADWAFSARLDRTKNTTGIGAIIASVTSALVSNALNGVYK